MSREAEKTKVLLDFKKKLEKKIKTSEIRLNELRSILESIDYILLEKGFKRAEIVEQPISANSPTPHGEDHLPDIKKPSNQYEHFTSMKAATGKILADLHVKGDSLRVVPARDMDFRVTTPPFSQFLVERVLEKMEKKDTELVNTGHLEPERALSYHIEKDGDTIKELVVKNFDADRLRELKASIRWTLEKMHQKTAQKTHN